MKIIIAGIGKLGEYLAKELSSDNNEIIIIDEKYINNREIVNDEEVFYINGNALNSNVLIEAGIKNADILISVMDKDEKNIMCSFLGKKLGVKRTIARIRTVEYSSSINLLKEDLGLSMVINPELMTASSIAKTLSIPSALDTITFFKGRLFMVSFKIKEENAINGLSFNNLSKKLPNKIIICAIIRNNKTIIPNGNDTIKVNDKVFVTGTRENIISFLRYANLASNKNKKVIISGGSPTAVYLAQMLSDTGMQVKIIEINEDRCRLLSEQLPNVMIINGDVSDQDLLYAEGIDECDSFISLNNIDEENIVHSMFAKGINVPSVITKVNHINLDGVLDKADIDKVITPHKIACNQIVGYVRAIENSSDSSCESVYKMDNDNFNMLEFIIKKGFKGIDTKLKHLNISKDCLIVAILRDKNIIYPGGNDEIKERDTIIVVSSNNRKVKEVNDILE